MATFLLATAREFIERCGVENPDQFLIVPADQFLLGHDPATTRVFLNPSHERELWPEEAIAIRENLQMRASRRAMA